MIIRYTPAFLRSVQKLDSDIRDKVFDQIETFGKNQKHPSLKAHKLKGKWSGFYAFSVGAKWRVIFEKIKSGKSEVVLLHQVGSHDIYKP
jgi:addiction module RelE/StbE family toxin